MNKDLLLKFGNRVKEIRIRKRFSQEELADIAGVHRTYIGMIERGEKNITIENIKKVADALDIEMNKLLEGV